MADGGNPIRLPGHVYVPGQTPRHPEGWFDPIRRSARPGMSVAALGRSQAMQAGLVYLEAGYFWESHEVLEAVWLALPEDAPERQVVQALIQLANARLKLLMGRPKATLRLCGMVEAHLAGLEEANLPPNMSLAYVRAATQRAREAANDAL